MTRVQLSGNSLWILLVIAALIAVTPSLLAQSAGTGALTGTVTDASGGVVPGVTVTLTGEAPLISGFSSWLEKAVNSLPTASAMA